LSSLAALSGGTDPNTSPGTIYGLSLGYAANSDVTGANDTANGNWTYAYDDMNRLITSTCGSSCTGSYSYEYDRFGNRWVQRVTGTGYNVNYSFDANNRISGGVTYDPPGNMTFDGVNYYTYDAENRLIAAGTSPGSSNIASYVYDAEGRRTSKTTGAQTLNYLYDLAGHQLAELTSSGLSTGTKSMPGECIWGRMRQAPHISTTRIGWVPSGFAAL
jgi:YD repeat-containing protein